MLEKDFIEAAERDWRETKEEERPRKTFIFAYVANHVSVKNYETLQRLVDVLKIACLVIGAPLLLAFLKYILGF